MSGARAFDTHAVDDAADRSVAVVVNGEPVVLSSDPTVAGLLAQRGLAGKRVAVERNGSIVPRSTHGATTLAQGDRVEIVVAVGGG